MLGFESLLTFGVIWQWKAEHPRTRCDGAIEGLGLGRAALERWRDEGGDGSGSTTRCDGAIEVRWRWRDGAISAVRWRGARPELEVRWRGAAIGARGAMARFVGSSVRGAGEVEGS
nr:hypothetical protein CFP56_44064 [Quercus suber]